MSLADLILPIGAILIALWAVRKVRRIRHVRAVQSGRAPGTDQPGHQNDTSGPLLYIHRPLFVGQDGIETRLEQVREIARRTEDFGRSLYPEETRAIRTSRAESARNLVDGLARMAPVTLFIGPAADEAGEEDRLLIDLFETLSCPMKVVDVSSDEDMHLGLPVDESGEPVLPVIYICGELFGDTAQTLDAARDGSLAARLRQGDVPHNALAAQGLAEATG